MNARFVRALALLSLASLSVGCATRYQPDDFAGTWRGQATCVNTVGSPTVEQVLSIEIGVQGRVEGTIAWRTLDAGLGHDPDGEEVFEDIENVIGIASVEDGSMALVETAEPGTLFARMRPDGRLELLRTQPGQQPVVTLATLARDDER
jgi:hypothetical protein